MPRLQRVGAKAGSFMVANGLVPGSERGRGGRDVLPCGKVIHCNVGRRQAN